LNNNENEQGNTLPAKIIFLGIVIFVVVSIINTFIGEDSKKTNTIAGRYENQTSYMGDTVKIGSYDFTIQDIEEKQSGNERLAIVELTVDPSRYFYNKNNFGLLQNHNVYLYVEEKSYAPEIGLDDEYNNGKSLFFNNYSQLLTSNETYGKLVFKIPSKGTINGLVISSSDSVLKDKTFKHKMTRTELNNFGMASHLFVFTNEK
jgi:hypothetical protein